MKNKILNVLGVLWMFLLGMFVRTAFRSECKGELFVGVIIIIALSLLGFTLTIGLKDKQ